MNNVVLISDHIEAMDEAQKKLIERYDQGKADVSFRTRLGKTINLLSPYINQKTKILDIGQENLMRRKIKDHFQCEIIGTGGVNLNSDFAKVEANGCNFITSFEVFEHLFNLYPLLQRLREFGIPLICSVPLRFPLSKQYWTEEYYDRHFNEFEPQQVRWILNEAGFQIIKEEFWYMDLNVSGVRPFLRTFLAPSWMALVCH